MRALIVNVSCHQIESRGLDSGAIERINVANIIGGGQRHDAGSRQYIHCDVAGCGTNLNIFVDGDRLNYQLTIVVEDNVLGFGNDQIGDRVALAQ